jgi:hypothetical protein
MKFAGKAPDKCDVCHKELNKRFVDGRTIRGYWAYMCSECHTNVGIGLGIGKGQVFVLTTKGWIKID